MVQVEATGAAGSSFAQDSIAKDMIRRVFVVGPKASGKSALVSRLLMPLPATTNTSTTTDSNASWDPVYRQTFGAEMAMKTIRTSDGSTCNLEIWCCGGHDRYQTVLMDVLLADADAVVLTLDPMDATSLEQIPALYQNIKRCTPSSKYYLVSTKADEMEQVKVKPAEIKRWAEEWALPYYPVSGMTGLGIQELFQEIATDLLFKA